MNHERNTNLGITYFTLGKIIFDTYGTLCSCRIKYYALYFDKFRRKRIFKISSCHLTSIDVPARQARCHGACYFGPQKDNLLFRKIFSPLTISLLIEQNVFFPGTYFAICIRNWFFPGGFELCQSIKFSCQRNEEKN